jgi:preprotein translocase subunit SecG
MYFKYKIHLYVYSVVPFALLAFLNVFLVYTVLTSGRSHVEPAAEPAGAAGQSSSSVVFGMKRKLQMTRTIIIITVLFIVITLPGAIASAYYGKFRISAKAAVL